MLDMLEQQQAQIDKLIQERDEIAAHYSVIYLSAKGLAHGKDWNKGTHAIEHGHRARLIEAVSHGDKAKQLLAQRDLEQQIKALESLLLEVQWSSDMGEEVVTGNEIDSRMYELKEQLRNGGEFESDCFEAWLKEVGND